MGQWRDRAGHRGAPTTAGDPGRQADWGVLSECPAIREFLTELPENCKGSEAATLLLYVDQDDRLVHVCLHDRVEGRSGWAAGLGFQDALLALEERLQGGKIEWRVKGQSGRARKRS